MTTFSIAELDQMSDDEFEAIVHGRRPAVEAGTDQRALMVEAHERWVETLEDDLREDVDWDHRTHSDWDLYAELRMNGVEFDRERTIEMSR